MKNEIDKSFHLACIQLENRNDVAYGCRDIAIFLRQSKSINTLHNERKKVFEPMFVLERTRKDKNKS